MKVSYKPTFIRQINKLEKGLQNEALEKIELFKDLSNHKILKVHKLSGKLSAQYSFSINYKYRIVFDWENKDNPVLLGIGDHSIYQ
jgi:plasmid maintenance system killer protein